MYVKQCEYMYTYVHTIHLPSEHIKGENRVGKEDIVLPLNDHLLHREKDPQG